MEIRFRHSGSRPYIPVPGEEYIRRVLKLVNASRREKERIARELRTHIADGMENEDLATILSRLGEPEEVARAFNEELGRQEIAVRGLWRLAVAGGVAAGLVILFLMWITPRGQEANLLAAGRAEITRPLNWQLLEEIEVPQDSFGAEKLLAADVTDDGTGELLGLDNQGAWLAARQADGSYARIWQGNAVALAGDPGYIIRDAAAGDLNGDGHDDLVVLAEFNDRGRPVRELHVALWHGDRYQWIATLPLEVSPGLSLLDPEGRGRSDIFMAVYDPEGGYSLQRWRLEGQQLVRLAESEPVSASTVSPARWGRLGEERRPVIAANFISYSAASVEGNYSLYRLFDPVTMELVAEYRNEGGDLVDLDGDGESELLRWTSTSNGREKLELAVWKDKKWSVLWELPAPVSGINRTVLTGDFNADGRQEIALVRAEAGGLQVTLLDASGEVIEQATLPNAGWRGISGATVLRRGTGQADLLALGSPQGTWVYSYAAGGNQPRAGWRLAWRGLDLRHAEVATAFDLEGDPHPELITSDGDVFTRQDGRYRFARSDAALAASASRLAAHYDLDGDGREEFVYLDQEGLVVARWEEDGPLPLATWPEKPVLRYSLAPLGPGGSPAILVAVPDQPSAEARGPRLEILTFDGQSLSVSAISAPLPCRLVDGASSVWQAQALASGRGGALLFVTTWIQDRTNNWLLPWEVAQAVPPEGGDWQEYGQPQSYGGRRPLLYPQSPLSTSGYFRPGQWMVAGQKYNSMGPVLSFLRLGPEGELMVEDRELSELFSAGFSSLQRADVDLDGQDELIVSAPGRILIYKEGSSR